MICLMEIFMLLWPPLQSFLLKIVMIMVFKKLLNTHYCVLYLLEICYFFIYFFDSSSKLCDSASLLDLVSILNKTGTDKCWKYLVEIPLYVDTKY